MSFLLRPFPAVAPAVSPVAVSPTQAMTGAGAFDAYAVLNKSPALVLGFADDYYRANKHSKPLSAVVTHSRARNATMVDSDGLIKWAPHNLLPYSNDFTDASWTGVTSVSSSTIASPDGSNAFKLTSAGGLSDYKIFSGVSSGQIKSVWARTVSGTGTVNILAHNSVSASLVTLTEEWQRFHLPSDLSETGGNNFYLVDFRGAGTLSEILVYGAHLYRSDLGGMVDVPAGERSFPSASTYVPTTSAARYLPRVGHHVYNGSAWVNEGVLAESEARTNLVTYSIPNATYWTRFGLPTVAVNDATAPDGTTSATRLTATVSTKHAIYFSESSGTHRSFFAKAGTANFIHIDYPSTSSGIWFDLANGVVATDATGVATIEDYGNGWYRCSCPSNNGNFSVGFSDADNSDSITVGAYGWVWGAQSENIGSTPSSYIPTAGSTVTRAAETFTIPAANLPYNSLAMSIQMNGRMTYADTGSGDAVKFVVWTINSSDNIEINLDTSSTRVGEVDFEQVASGVLDRVSDTDAYSPGIFVPFNIASRHGMTFINGAVDGTALTANTTPTNLPDLSATDLSLAYKYMGTVETFRIWGVDLGDGGIENATTGEPASYVIWDQANDDYVQRIF